MYIYTTKSTHLLQPRRFESGPQLRALQCALFRETDNNFVSYQSKIGQVKNIWYLYDSVIKFICMLTLRSSCSTSFERYENFLLTTLCLFKFAQYYFSRTPRCVNSGTAQIIVRAKRSDFYI